MTIYLIGLNGSTRLSLMKAVEKMDYIIDVRYSPKSQAARRPAGMHHLKSEMQEMFGDRYQHIKELGVKDKRTRSMALTNPEAFYDWARILFRDFVYILEMMEQSDKKYALLCQEKPGEVCHRYVLAELAGAPKRDLIATR